jgi:uncharacterized membrane protein
MSRREIEQINKKAEIKADLEEIKILNQENKQALRKISTKNKRISNDLLEHVTNTSIEIDSLSAETDFEEETSAKSSEKKAYKPSSSNSSKNISTPESKKSSSTKKSETSKFKKLKKK